MRLVATSDLHGHLPKIPTCDVLVIAGDILPLGVERDWPAVEWLERQFKPWLEYVPANHIVGIAGNHDFAIQDRWHDIEDLQLPWTYLQDSGTEIDGVKFWGVPWVPNLPTWAFYGEEWHLDQVYRMVPQDTNVVISHGPPAGHMDSKYHYGARQVNDMLGRVKPKVCIFGHVHEGYGIERGYRKTTDLYNVSHCDLTYSPVNPARVIRLVPTH